MLLPRQQHLWHLPPLPAPVRVVRLHRAQRLAGLVVGVFFAYSNYRITLPTGLFRVRGIIHPPGISPLDGPILKSFEVVIVHCLRFCLVYLDGLHVGNYPSKICHDF